MIIIEGMDILPRALEASLINAATVMPVVVVTGARQTGKSTLARGVSGRPYLSLDDLDVLEQAESAPHELVGRADRLTIDEVQRAPQLLLAVKKAVDEDRRPGRFLLTGSANLLMMTRVADSLAGRAAYLTLGPLTRREQLGLGSCGAWSELLGAPDRDWADILKSQVIGAEDWRDLAKRGGLPIAALSLESVEARSLWFRSYLATYLERDLQDLSAIAGITDFRRLMKVASLRLGQLVNQTELGRDAGLPQPTVHRYLNLLELSCHLVRLPAYARNRTKRLIKTPKLYWSDTGVAAHLAGGVLTGAHLENLVLSDLLVWRSQEVKEMELAYWRTASGEEVDFVVEFEGQLVPIEVKSASRPRLEHIRHLRAFREEYGSECRPALLLHDGDSVEWLAPGILAAPWWTVI